MEKVTDDHIVVTGFGAITPLGSNSRETWNAVLSGQCGICPPAGIKADETPCLRSALVEDLRASDLGIGRKDARFMRKSGLMLLKASQDAFLDARLDELPVPAEQTGFFAGTGAVDAGEQDLLPALLGSLDPQGELSHTRFFADAYRAIHPLWPLSILNNIAFCQTAIRLNVRGENAVFSPYNDAGAQAVLEGVRTLRQGRARAVVVSGGSEAATPFSMARATNSGLPIAAGASPDAPCRPFSNRASGTVLGEGAGALVLERRTHALMRGVGFHARISGYGDACIPDGEGCGPTVEAVKRSMEAALVSARRNFEDMDVLIAHGDGTGADHNEIAALNALFDRSQKGPRVFYPKAALGNLLAGAPLVDAVLAMFMISEGRIPHTLNADAAGSRIHLPVVRGCPLEASVKRIMINSRGPGGQTASFIMEGCK